MPLGQPLRVPESVLLQMSIYASKEVQGCWNGTQQGSCEHHPEVPHCFPLVGLSSMLSRSKLCFVYLLWLLMDTKGLVRVRGREPPDSWAKAQHSWPGHSLKEAEVVVTRALHVTSLQTDGHEVWQTSCANDLSNSHGTAWSCLQGRAGLFELGQVLAEPVTEFSPQLVLPGSQPS